MIPPAHLHIFSETSLACILNIAGFKPIEIWNFGQDINELFSTLNYERSECCNEYVVNQISNLAGLQEVVDDNYLSDSMIVISKKE